MIPKKLQQEGFRFIPVANKQKIPLEKKWTEKNYTYYDPSIIEHIKKFKNYGVVCGYNDLLVIDCDDGIAEKLVRENLPKTYSTKASKLPHFYFICKDAKNLKVYKNINRDKFADIQFKGKFVVGAGSEHNSGVEYKVLEDLPIAEIKFSQVIYCFKDYLFHSYPEKKVKKKGENIETDDTCKQINEKITIKGLLNEAGIDTTKNPTMCPLGHSSDKQQCFSFTDETFHCFHCEESGSIFDLYIKLKKVNFYLAKKQLAQRLGIPFKDSSFREILPYFYDKYGIWWLWDTTNFRYNRVDDIDILNMVRERTGLDVITSKFRSETLNKLKQEGRENIPKNVKKTWVQLKDKIYDVATGETINASHEYFVTNPIPHEIGECEDTPVIDELFISWVGEDHKQELYEVIAFCFVGNYFIHRIILLIGTGSNGKSTFLNLISMVLGVDNLTSSSLHLLMKERFEGSKLYKKSVCLMGETNFTLISNTDFLKRLTGEDLVRCEFKGKDSFDFLNYAKLIIATNNLPPTADKTEGFYRRWKIIEFIGRFLKELDVLKNITEEEIQNLIKKCLRIASQLWDGREFTNDGTFEDRRKAYEEKSNPLGLFLKEFYEKDINSEIPFFEFYNDFSTFLRERGHRDLTNTAVSSLLKNTGFEIKTLSYTKPDGEKSTARHIMGLIKCELSDVSHREFNRFNRFNHNSTLYPIEELVKKGVKSVKTVKSETKETQNEPQLKKTFTKLIEPTGNSCSKCGDLSVIWWKDQDSNNYCVNCKKELEA